MQIRNPGIPFDQSKIEGIYINQPAVEDYVKNLCANRAVKKEYQVAWLLRAVTCLDLTTLCGDDSYSNIQRLCFKAGQPVQSELLKAIGMDKEQIQVGAVCVYPARVAEAKSVLNEIGSNIPIAAVATGFPSGQYHLQTRLQEINLAINDGATEIDIVINRDLVHRGNWKELYKEVENMHTECDGKARLKTILAAGELGSLTNVYKASLVCMMAGADFIKTSTGKESVNATLPIGLVMARAIRDYYRDTRYEVGFKPAGGIRTAKDAISWQILMKEELGDDWLAPDLFRIGASGLLGDIERQIFHYATGCYASPRSFTYL